MKKAETKNWQQKIFREMVAPAFIGTGLITKKLSKYTWTTQIFLTKNMENAEEDDTVS